MKFENAGVVPKPDSRATDLIELCVRSSRHAAFKHKDHASNFAGDM